MQRKVESKVQTIPHQLTVPPLPVTFSAQPYTPGRSLRCAEYRNTVRAGITTQQNEWVELYLYSPHPVVGGIDYDDL